MTVTNSARDRAPSGLRRCRIVGAAALLLVAVAGLTPAANRLAARYAEPEQLIPSDAIVVLGGDFTPDGWLDTAGSRRLLHGILLYRRGLAPLLVLSGGTPRGGPSEAEMRERIAREMGVPPGSTLAVVGANTTREEAVLVGAALRPRGVRSILLVSGPFHLVRARAVFARQGLEVRTAPVEDVFLGAQKPGSRLVLARALAQEVAGWLYYRLVGAL
jgi:uncharacterized SAM-binding protein YcdF (DUF218 family)